MKGVRGVLAAFLALFFAVFILCATGSALWDKGESARPAQMPDHNLNTREGAPERCLLPVCVSANYAQDGVLRHRALRFLSLLLAAMSLLVTVVRMFCGREIPRVRARSIRYLVSHPCQAPPFFA